MNCAACGHENPERAKFCLECGAPFVARCGSCGVELPPAAKFCLECGTRVGAAPSAPARPVEAGGARTVVSIIFADLVGSTALHERLDAESVRQFMEGYYAAMRGAVEAYGGRVTQVMGDGVKAVFGAPRVAEDDAIRAVRAAVAMQAAFRALAEQQSGRVGKTGLRVAVNTGEVVSDGESEIIGDPVNVAARLQEQGKDGDVVIGGATQRIVGALVTLELLGRFALKGRAEQVEAYRVVSLEPPAATKAAFVGRDEELARLTAVYETAAHKPAAQLAVVLGSPGLGKSRLIDEFARRLGEGATVLTAHCDASGGATFAPLAAALREHLGIEDGAKAEALRAALEAALPSEDAERARVVGGVATLLGGSPASPEETFFVVRRLLAALATARPVVLVIDDLHWAESLLLDLVEHLVQWGSGVPLFVLVGARPELRELRGGMVVPGGLVADVLTLSGLDAGAAMRLAAGVIGAADLPAALAGKLLATSEGNPLFVGELIKMLVQEGVLQRDGERWVASAALADLEMPPTIHALLAARIERLRPEERVVLERAAVVGRHFSKSAVAALLASPAGLDARLEALRRSELIERDTGWFLGEPVLRFHHVLIRDAAYRRVLKGTRAELHARLAGWIEGKTGDAAEHDETIGWHLEQAHQHLAELGLLDANGVELGVRAAQRLAAAGRRALVRDDLALAANLLGRALACLPAEAEERADLALDWCEALLSTGDVGPAAKALEELARAGAGSERLRAWHTCFAGQLSTLTSPQGLQATADSAAAAATALAALGDAAGEAKAHFVNAQALARLGRVGACEAALDLALAAARRAGDRRRANAVLAGAPRAALWGPSPVTRASGRCLDVVRVLRITQGAPAVEAVALSCQGVLEALRGRTDAAKRMIASARKLVEELGIAHRLFEADVFAGRVALLEGDAGSAERSLRGAYEGLRDLGLGIDAAQAAALLARALLAAGRAAEAEALTRESETLAGDDLQAAIAWRGARAEALAQRGEHDEAVRHAQAAVEIAAATDALLDHADARLALAAALRAAGRGAEADAEERRACELWETKGATLLAERAARAGERTVRTAPAAAAPRRRVRPNAATENAARLDAAVAARDGDALLDLFTDDIHILEHAAGASFDHAGAVASWRGLITARDPASQHEPLATLGESLALLRLRLSASGSRGRTMDVGAYDKDEIHTVETDGQGRRRAGEAWSLNHLGDAIARLYERHAELLPEGPERARAEAFARSISAMASQPDTARRAAVFAPDIEVADHRTLGTWSARGAESALRHFESIFQVSDAPTLRDHDVLALAPDALLTLRAHTGVGKQSGGAYERRFLNLLVAGADGRLARIEWFDADREAEALARFDALAGAAPPPVLRRVRANAATDNAARLDAAIAARDADLLPALFADDLRVVDHTTGAEFGREEGHRAWRSLIRSREPICQHEPLAALGDSLGLFRVRLSASGSRWMDVGAWDKDEIHLVEADGRGQRRCGEVWAPGHLGDAIARLYERYAELLPAGPERTRADATARSVARQAMPFDLDGLAAGIAPEIDVIDHRSVGFGRLRGAEALLAAVRAMLELSDGVEWRLDDVLGSRPDALLVRSNALGVERAGGGTYEVPFLELWAFGTDGKMARYERFDPEQEALALARFDARTGAAEPPPLARRRISDTGATRLAGRMQAAIEARDLDAIAALHAEPLEVIHHPSGTSYGLPELMKLHRNVLRGANGKYTEEPLAALGDSLVLLRRRVTHEGVETRVGSIGPVEVDTAVLKEVDERGLVRRSEAFDSERLGGALVRLYERYAEQLPDGPEKVRAEGMARSLAAFVGPVTLERWEAAYAPDVEQVDHRTLGSWSARGRAQALVHLRSLLELVSDAAMRVDDVLAAVPSLVLDRRTHLGTDLASGGRYERPFLGLLAAGTDGRTARLEFFDPDREAEAFARFDALTAASAPAPAPRGFENAAARAEARLMHSFNTRDWPGVLTCIAPQIVFDERRRMTRNTADREVWLEQFRLMFDQPASRFTIRLLATRGERLSLHRHEFEAEVAGGGGRLEMEPHFALHEVDAEGLIVAIVLFDLADEAAAYAELDARFDAGDEPHRHAAAAAREFRRAFGSRDWDAFARLLAPGFSLRDHRPLGFDAANGARYLDMLRALVELAPDTVMQVDDVRTAVRGFLLRAGWRGTRDGGAFETPFIGVMEVDAQGALLGIDACGPEQHAEAFTRFAELAAPTAERPFANAATRASDRLVALWSVRDWAGLARFLPARFRFHDRRRIALLEIDREAYVASMRTLGEMESTHIESELIATRGERLALMRRRIELAGGDVGPSQLQNLTVTETDERGEPVALLRFDDDNLDGAFTELDARFAAGEGAAHPAATAWNRDFLGALARRDWDALAATLAPSFVADDHRLAGWGTLLGPARFVDVLRAMLELASDAHLRVDHLRASRRMLAGHNTWVGTREGGAFEIPFATLLELDAEGRAQRLDQYDSLDAPHVLTRFAEITAGEAEESTAPSPFANLATRAVERGAARMAARDWEGFRALLAPGFRYVDRTAIDELETGRDEWLAAFREQIEMTAGPLVPRVLATRGERLALVRLHWRGAGGDVGESELDWLLVIEVDERGDHIAVVNLDPSDLASAVRELDARFAAGEGAASGAFAAVERVYAAIYRRDRETFLAQLAPGFRIDDHRRLGWGGLLEDGEWVFRANDTIIEMAPDFRYRVDHFEVRGRAFLTQVAQVGTREGGPFESPFLYTGAVDERGLLARYEVYDVDEIEAARARFDALAAKTPADSPFANAATRAEDRIIAVWQAQDWEGHAWHVPEGFHLSDRRQAVQLELDGEAALEFSRSLVEGRSGRIRRETLATRGERLALSRWWVAIAGGDVGESEIRHLNLFDVDERGAPRSLVRWDDDSLEAAYAELDARHAAHAPAWMPRFCRAVAARDWDAIAALCASDLVAQDHRLVNWGTLQGLAAYLPALRSMVELAPDVRLRLDHLRCAGRGELFQTSWLGTREGGPFEIPLIGVSEADEHGRQHRFDLYDLEKLDQARVRFAAITTAAPAEERFANAAWRSWQEVMDTWRSRDLARFAALHGGGLRYRDRRRLFLLDLDREQFLDFTRPLIEMRAAAMSAQLLATRGERLALVRLHMEMAGDDVGASEIDSLLVVEVDERGAPRQYVRFDPDDEAAARAELDARHGASDHSAGALWLREFRGALGRRDWDAAAAIYTPDVVGDDHRLVGWGTLRGPVAFLESLRQMVALAPDARVRADHVRTHERGVIIECAWVGTREGGAFESPFVSVLELAPEGRGRRNDFYDPQHLPQALARFEALRPDPLRIPPNASTRANDRWWALAGAGDWEAVRALTEGMAFEDRRRLIRIAGGGELLLADTRHLWDSGWRPERTLVATAGDRLSLERMLWTLDAGGQASEIEVLKVAEVDAEGRIVAYLIFDPSERAAASEELFERWARHGEAGFPRATLEFLRAWNQHDRARMQALLPGDYVFHDHRRTGIGRIEGAAPYLDSLTALWELSPDVRLEMLYVIARAPNAFLGVLRWSGTNAEAGEFEAVFIGVTRIQGEQQVGVDLFEIDEMNTALARFEELSAQTAPSSSTRAR